MMAENYIDYMTFWLIKFERLYFIKVYLLCIPRTAFLCITRSLLYLALCCFIFGRTENIFSLEPSLIFNLPTLGVALSNELLWNEQRNLMIMNLNEIKDELQITKRFGNCVLKYCFTYLLLKGTF